MIRTDPRTLRPYVLERHRELPPEQRPVFQLRGLTIDQKHDLYDEVVVVEGKSYARMGRRVLKSLRFALAGAKRFVRDDGSELEWSEKHGVVTDEFLEGLRLSDRIELGNAIEGELRFDVEDMGKSSPPST